MTFKERIISLKGTAVIMHVRDSGVKLKVEINWYHEDNVEVILLDDPSRPHAWIPIDLIGPIISIGK